MSVSAGNGGPTCASVRNPPGIYESVFTVGATVVFAERIADFSSRGPGISQYL